MSHIIHRNLRYTPPVAASGDGMRITDRNGNVYIDASGGAAVSCLGHGHPDVLEALHEQIDRLAYAHTSFFTSDVAEELASTLVENAPTGLSEVYLVSGGSEAVETALKLARQYFVEIGQPERSVFLARRQSYHGNTLGALAVGGNEWRRAQFAPLLMDVARLSPCYEYRDRADTETQDAYTDRLIAEFEAKIAEVGAHRIIAFVAETVVGATAGAVPPTPSYFKKIRALCDKHGILIISDEVMCGMGRTGTLYGVEQDDFSPDLLTIAKGLGGGYQPIGAVLAQKRIVEALRTRSGLFQHGHTYLGHPIAAAAALAVQKVIKRDGLLDAVKARGNQLMSALQTAFGAHPNIGDIRGRGLFVGLEFVTDRATKQPFNPDYKLHAQLKSQAMANGLMIYPMGGTIDGRQGDHILLAPPFIATADDIDEIVSRLVTTVDAAIKAVHTLN